ncbi:MAG TPA: hypothetical protein DC049_18345, partial [Spirochaetia bacterium]|nr:hypothetical protein [Spirochaetia bacterium]
MHKKLIIIPVLFVFFRLCAQNLIPDSGFESGEWKGNFRSGQGKIEISTKNPHSGKQCMTLSGISSDAKGQIFSGDIPVTADSRYLFDCFYRLDGNGVIQVRYTAGDVLCGYVFSVKPTGGSWRSLVLALKEKSAACIFYPAGLGKSERTTMDNTILSFPQGVTGININISISGISFLAVDDLSLSEIKETALGKTSGTLAAEDEEEMKRLLIKKGDPIQDEMRDPSIKLIIRDVDLPVKYETVQEQFPESATNLRVRGNCFYRGNKPVFLLGVEQTLNYYPWLCNLLGMDFSHINDLYPEASARIKQESSTYEVYWEPYNMLEPVIKRLLRSGIAACPQIIESGTSLAPLKKVCPDLYANCSHFFAFRHDMPEGRRLRENTWKSFTGITRRYPVFAYELFNEVRYMDYSPDNTTGFKKAMMQKYKNIQAANSAWGTLFASFETLEIPRKSSSYNGTEQGIKPADFSRMLFRDWTVFNETVFSEVQASQNRLIKNLDRRLPLYTTCQSVCDLSRGKSGSDGVDPVLKNRHEDIFGLEPGTGQAYYPQYGRGNYEEIRRMLLGPLVYDIARAIAGNKPVWHLEQTVSGAANLYSADSLLTDLSGKWNFADDRDKSGEKKGWHKKEFSDKNWESVTVPGMWGPQGYSNCTTGWYRRRFIPDKKISSERLFLNGEQLTDRARIFINDILVHETKSWSERFGVDITPHVRFGEENIIAVEIENNYFNAGFYWGGIRVGISIDSRNYGEVQPLTAAQMRSWLWEKAVHGNSGIMMSYFYGGEASGAGPLFSPLTHSLASIQIIPRVREEINSLADIVLEQPYCRSRIALLYSLESGRYRIYKDSTEWMKSAALYDLADFYAALVFSRISPDVIPNETLLSDDLSAYRCLILRMSERVKPGTLERITEYVKKGGILIIDHGSLAVNDEYNTRLDLSELAGISIGDALGEIRSVSLSGSTGIKTVARSSDGATGRNISLRSAKAAAVFTGTDSPAISLNRVGSGKVYYLAAEFSPDA